MNLSYLKDYLERCKYRDYVFTNIIPDIKLNDNNVESIDEKINRLKGSNNNE